MDYVYFFGFMLLSKIRIYKLEVFCMTYAEANAIDALVENLPKIASQKKNMKLLNDFLQENHNFLYGYIDKLFIDRSMLRKIDDDELIVILHAIYDVMNYKQLDPALFYREEVIKSALKLKKKINHTYLSLPLELNSVLRVTKQDYLTVLSYKQIYELHESKLITYNLDTQRIAKKIRTKIGEVVKMPTIKKESVQSIYQMMKRKEYDPSTIILNILLNGDDNIEYDEGTLTIGEGTTINIIDGYHRIQAIIRIIQEDPNYEGYMNVDIKHYPVLKAKKLLATTNTTNPFDKTQRMKFASATYGAEIVNSLENLPELKERISEKGFISKSFNELTTYSIMVESIDAAFQPQNNKEKYEIEEFLKKFYSYFLNYYKEEFENRLNLLQESWFVHHNMFVLFNAIAKNLFDAYGIDFSVGLIPKAIAAIDFNKNSISSKLNNILITQGKTNSNAIRRKLLEFGLSIKV